MPLINYALTFNDEVRGGDTQDRITGNNYDERLMGFKGNDFLEGFEGDDLLVGGQGRDRLKGGKGADVFAFDHINEGGDTIDFVKAQGDKIAISSISGISSKKGFAYNDHTGKLSYRGKLLATLPAGCGFKIAKDLQIVGKWEVNIVDQQALHQRELLQQALFQQALIQHNLLIGASSAALQASNDTIANIAPGSSSSDPFYTSPFWVQSTFEPLQKLF